MRFASKFILILTVFAFGIAISTTSCSSGHNTSMDKRIKKQKKRKKKNPTDCPRIDCSIEKAQSSNKL